MLSTRSVSGSGGRALDEAVQALDLALERPVVLPLDGLVNLTLGGARGDERGGAVPADDLAPGAVAVEEVVELELRRGDGRVRVDDGKKGGAARKEDEARSI